MDQAAVIEHVETADEATIGYSRRGSGEPVLFVHGTIGSAESWRLVAPHLESDFTVVAMDRRGRGESTDGAAGYSVEVDAEDVVAVIEALGEPVHLVGHSYGAAIALLAAARSPDVRSLVIYEPMLAMDRLPFPLEPVADRMEELIRSGDPAAAAELWLRTLARTELFRPEEVDGFMDHPDVWPRFVATVPTVPREARTAHTLRGVHEVVGRIRVPVLSLVGENTTTPAVLLGLDEVEAALPDVRRELIPGQWHLATAFDPEAMAERIIAFIQGVTGTP